MRRRPAATGPSTGASTGAPTGNRSGTSRPRFEVTIDEVVLRGIPHHEAEAVIAQLRTTLDELAQAWISRAGPDDGALPPARTESSRRLPPVTAPAGSPGALGAAVAARVWDELAAERRPTRPERGPAARGDGR